ncbi:MAG: hydrogenase expression/formation protein HypE [Campylobacter sp.]|nr:hydrogenase expression/formation protein HypE [Campylobacter sp.]
MNNKILLAHGGGGEEMNALIYETIFKIFDNEILNDGNDSALLSMSGELAFSSDSFVVTPLFFAGTNIGKIAACGTINDLAMVGAAAKYLSCSLIIEEGFELEKLKTILGSLAKIAKQSDVKIVCGDTKVVPKGKCDGLFINTSGVGEVLCKCELKNLCAGAKILLSGDIGRHGAVVLASREELDLQSDLQSDCKSLKAVVMALLDAGIKPLAMRDATRGGLSAVLNEWAKASGYELEVREADIAVSNEVIGICELFGFEAYELANEGTFVLAVLPQDEQKALEILKKFDENAASIGEILDKKNARVVLQTAYGSKRFLEAPKGELLPRIC